MKKRIVIFIIIAGLVLALIPFGRAYLDDGGTVVYEAACYSVTKYHRMVTQPDSGQLQGYEVGWRVEILGMTVYEKTELEKVTADAEGKLELRHDREPIDNHFPSFPDTKELTWVAYSLYDDRDPGPTINGILATNRGIIEDKLSSLGKI